jgi:hypothetical protein
MTATHPFVNTKQQHSLGQDDSESKDYPLRIVLLLPQEEP